MYISNSLQVFSSIHPSTCLLPNLSINQCSSLSMFCIIPHISLHLFIIRSSISTFPFLYSFYPFLLPIFASPIHIYVIRALTLNPPSLSLSLPPACLSATVALPSCRARPCIFLSCLGNVTQPRNPLPAPSPPTPPPPPLTHPQLQQLPLKASHPIPLIVHLPLTHP